MSDYLENLEGLFAQEKVRLADRLALKDLPRVSNPEAGIRAVNFIQRLCTHTKGRWAGRPFVLLDWQFLFIWQLFGVCRADGYRQYRFGYLEIPKKNGKSELAAAIALKLLVADDEQGGEVYGAAVDIIQAGLVYAVAAQMVRNNRLLSNRLKVLDSRKRIVDYKTNSFYQVLSAEIANKHGLNPSGIVFDELHAQPNRNLWDVLVEGTHYAREQQLVVGLTTAGVYDKESIGWEIHDRARQISDGVLEDKTFLPVIYAADEDVRQDPEKYGDPNVWEKHNPSIGQIFDIEKIQEEYETVKGQPSRINNFLRFRLNLWVNQLTRWIDMFAWDACKVFVDRSELFKRECYGGLDLASKRDLTAFALVFPPREKGEKWLCLVDCYAPANRIMERVASDNVPYNIWRDEGFLKATPGDMTDYELIRQDVNQAARQFDLREVAFDPWNSTHIAGQLDNEDGIVMVEHRQGYASMSEPSKEFEARVFSRQIGHDGNPILRWAVDNLVITQDASGNIKPAKDKAREKIDPAVAVIMALGRAIRNFDEDSVYEERGLLLI